MIFLHISDSTIKTLTLTKAVLGQFSVSYFHKIYASQLIEDGRPASIDILASSIKEALVSAKPQPITDKEVCLILPQEAFSYARYTIPADISPSALLPFIKDKVRSELFIDIDTEHFDYIINNDGPESTLLFYAISKEVYAQYEQVARLLQLKIKMLLPESIAIFNLFEKATRRDKKENILYFSYEEANSFGYLYDTFGLLKKERLLIPHGDVPAQLKTTVQDLEQKYGKINRLVLSGVQSRTVRQDLFTKEIGAWTNLLEKIIDTNYQDYLKTMLPNSNEHISFLLFDACLGAFIHLQEKKEFNILRQQSSSRGSSMSLSMPSFGFLSGIFAPKTLLIFVVSFAISFGLIFAFLQLDATKTAELTSSFRMAKPTSTPMPTPKPTNAPTPSMKKEEIKIKVLNGSGTKGKANDVKEVLQDAGYSDIITGNADTFDLTATIIAVKKGKQDIFNMLKKDLADSVAKPKQETLAEDETADVVITFGSDFE